MCHLSRFVGALILATLFVSIHSQELSVCSSPSPYAFYPSYNGSSYFVRCDPNSEEAPQFEVYTCPEGQVFNPRTSIDDKSPLCVSTSSQNGGAVFGSCPAGNGNVSYSGDPTLYAECQNGSPIDLLQCSKGEYFIESTAQCDITCAVRYKIGSFALSDNSYYTCDFDQGTYRWKVTVKTCDDGEMFDESYQFCLPESTT